MTAGILAAVVGLALSPVLITLSLTHGVEAVGRGDTGATVLNAALGIVCTSWLAFSIRFLTLTIGGSAL